MITIMYSCKGCGLKDAPVEVEERGEDEDIVHWVESLGQPIANNHALVSSDCRARTCDIKIPVPPGDESRPGDATKH